MARTYGELDALVVDLPRPAALTSPRRVTRGRRSPVLPWLVAFAALLLILMVMAVGVAVREHSSSAAPFSATQTAASSASP